MKRTPFAIAALLASSVCLARDGIDLHGRIQFGLIGNDNGSDNVFPSGFLNFDEGLNLNRIDLIAEKKLKTNIHPRIGPFPGPKPGKPDWGFEIDLRYGRDAAITYGLDDELDINEGKKNLWLAQQWFLRAYQPWGGGFSLIAGSWFTPLGYEIGAPVDPPTGFYTHSYAFIYGPSKHVGLMGAMKLPVEKAHGLWSLGLGIVQGWNNLQDNNHDKTLLLDLRWRSADFHAWVDFENIIGNEQSENGVTDQTRPFNAISTHGEKLLRRMHSLTLNQRIDKTRRWTLNAIYGYQEGGDLVADAHNPPGFLITEDSAWYGINLNYYDRFRPDMQFALRAEWLRDAKGAHALLPAGDYYAITINLSWWPLKQLRIRPELRYDYHDGPGKAFGGRVPTVFFGEENRQWLASIDLTWFYHP